MNFVRDLHRHRARHFSQNGEDGVIERLMAIVGVTNRFYVEMGTGSGEECNTRYLREQGWSGVMIDRDQENPALDLHKEFVTAANVDAMMAKYGVPDSFDLLSIDIDGNDYWVWKALAPRYRPRVVVIEYNAGVPCDVSVTIPYDPDYHWVGQPNTGQSLLALTNLSRAKGYSLVYANPPNAFLVLTSVLPQDYQEVSVAVASRESWIIRRRRRAQWRSTLSHLSWVSV
jgi:hypothetical protein